MTADEIVRHIEIVTKLRDFYESCGKSEYKAMVEFQYPDHLELTKALSSLLAVVEAVKQIALSPIERHDWMDEDELYQKGYRCRFCAATGQDDAAIPHRRGCLEPIRQQLSEVPR